MVIISPDQKALICRLGLEKIGQKYGNNYKCEHFVREIYTQVGISTDFNNQPVLSFEDIFKDQYIGYLCFLKNKKYVQELYRFTHVGIIFPDEKLLHYTRYFGEPDVREVFLTPLTGIFEVYNIAIPS